MPVTITHQMRQAIRVSRAAHRPPHRHPAVRIADPAAPDLRPSQRLRPYAQNRAAELSLTAPKQSPSHPDHVR